MPRTVFVLLLLLVNAISVAAGAELELTPVRAAITRSIPWLEKDMVAWRESNDCAACHHGPMYVWSSHVARRQGYPVNEKQLQDYARWMIEDEKARVFPSQAPSAPLTSSTSAADRMTALMMGHRNLSQPTLYLAHALNALPPGDPLVSAGWQKLQQHWREAQMDDGSFAGRKGWPPIFNSPKILTLFAATALEDRQGAGMDARELKRSLDQIQQRTASFLASQQPDATHQGLVLRLLLQTQFGAGPQPLLDEILALQREDGGWSQTPDSSSDAFATGQSLYALSRAGVQLSEKSLVQGLNFLVKSQAGDGTWPMTSRASPETGRPADDLNPITYAATAWATIGMASYVHNAR